MAVVNSGSTSYTVNDVNQYTAVGAATPTYNDRGDLATHGDWEYTYDASGNLIRAHNTQSNVLAKYWRDASGQRAVKDVDGEKEIFFNSGPNLLEVYDVGAESALSYVYEPGVDRPLAQIAEDGTVQYFHQDVLGSVRALTNAGGAIVQTFTYSVWGEAVGKNSGGTVIASSEYASRWLFTGRQYDAETGLYHFRARAYSTELGRFLQNDPADFDGGDLNLFRYCLNSPLDLCDPFGLAWTLCTTAEEATDLDTAPTSPPPPGPNGPNNPPPGGKPGTKIFDHSPGNKGGAGGAGGGGSVVIGVNIDLALPFGGLNFGTGLYFNGDGTGGYAYGGGSKGFDVSIGLAVGLYKSSELSGASQNVNLGGGPIGTTQSYSNGNAIGGAVSGGPSLTPLSGSLSTTSTVISPPYRYIPTTFIYIPSF